MYDPFKGVIPGFIENEIHYIGEEDPVVYNLSRTNFCEPEMIGKVWWDTSTIRYNWYEQGSTRDRWLNWGSSFPGSTISLYEWTKSNVPPAEWTLSGTPRNTFIVKSEKDPKSGLVVDYYYYWVRNKRVLLDFVKDVQNRKYPTFTLATYLAEPLNYGINMISFVDNKSFVLHNIAQILNDNNDNLQINFSFSFCIITFSLCTKSSKN